jgi:conjugative relaxase-like TrwC/TraI family protein
MWTFSKFMRGAAHGVYLSKNAYYQKRVNGVEIQVKQVIGVIDGELAKAVGVEKGMVVTDAMFEALSAGKNVTTGEKLMVKYNTTRDEKDDNGNVVMGKDGKPKQVSNRIELTDATVSAPKTFSVLIGLGQNEAASQWHEEARAKSFAQIQKDAGRQNKDKEQKRHVKTTGNVVCARYRHDASRAQECQTHDHHAIFSLTEDSGKIYALENRVFYERARFYTAIYRDQLCHLAYQAGLPIEFDKWGAPQISILQGIAEKNSTRSDHLKIMIDEIEEFVGSELTRNEKSVLIHESRGLDVEVFKEKWDAKKENLQKYKDLDPDTAENSRLELFKIFTETVRKSCIKNGELLKIITEELREDALEKLTPEELQILDDIKDGRVNVAPPTIATLDESITHSIEKLFERNSTVTTGEFYTSVLVNSCGLGVDLDEMEKAVAARPEIHVHNGHVISNELLALEEESLLYIERGINRGARLGKISTNDLNPDQLKAVNDLIRSDQQFVSFSGVAGAGKTSALDKLIKQNDACGYRVLLRSSST